MIKKHSKNKFSWIVGTSGIDQSSGKPAIETVGPRGKENIF